MNSKRFVFVIEDLYGGGAQKSLINTAEGLRQRGHQVTVFILRDLIEHRLPPGLEVINLALVNGITKAISNVLVEKWQAWFIARAIRRLDPHVVLSCSCDKITRHIKHPNLWFWVKSNMLASRYTAKSKAKAKAKLQRFYNGRKVIGCSQGVVDGLLQDAELKPERILAIYNPYERDGFVRMAAEPAAVPTGDYLINVGTFEHRKRHDRLLRAYKASGVSTPLLLLGKGKPEEEARLRALIRELDLEEQVILPGYQTNPYPYIKHAKALILTSDGEGLPRVLIESLFLGTPIVSVDCPSGPKEILTGELAAFLVPLQDEVALADAIGRMDASPVTITADYYQAFLAESVLPQFEALSLPDRAP
jgi:glycosyltransferase involved in cell wall biosynthesis